MDAFAVPSPISATVVPACDWSTWPSRRPPQYLADEALLAVLGLHLLAPANSGELASCRSSQPASFAVAAAAAAPPPPAPGVAAVTAAIRTEQAPHGDSAQDFLARKVRTVSGRCHHALQMTVRQSAHGNRGRMVVGPEYNAIIAAADNSNS